MDKDSPVGRSQRREWHGEGAVKEPGTQQAEAGPVCQAELPLAGDREPVGGCRSGEGGQRGQAPCLSKTHSWAQHRAGAVGYVPLGLQYMPFQVRAHGELGAQANEPSIHLGCFQKGGGVQERL